MNPRAEAVRHAKSLVVAAFERCNKTHPFKPRLLRVSHIYPRAYVLSVDEDQAKVAVPWVDAAPHLRDLRKQGQQVLNACVGPEVKAGDWVCMGYCVTPIAGERYAALLELT